MQLHGDHAACRELHRLRQQWQSRGKGQSPTALAGHAAVKGQTLQQLKQSLLNQQSPPDTPKASLLHPGKSFSQSLRGQGRSEQPDSPVRSSCSPRCRVAKGDSWKLQELLECTPCLTALNSIQEQKSAILSCSLSPEQAWVIFWTCITAGLNIMVRRL